MLSHVFINAGMYVYGGMGDVVVSWWRRHRLSSGQSSRCGQWSVNDWCLWSHHVLPLACLFTPYLLTYRRNGRRWSLTYRIYFIIMYFKGLFLTLELYFKGCHQTLDLTWQSLATSSLYCVDLMLHTSSFDPWPNVARSSIDPWPNAAQVIPLTLMHRSSLGP